MQKQRRVDKKTAIDFWNNPFNRLEKKLSAFLNLQIEQFTGFSNSEHNITSNENYYYKKEAYVKHVQKSDN
jgi:hypothetical protein